MNNLPKTDKFKPLKILMAPNPKLRRVCVPVSHQNSFIQIERLIELMKKTMKFYNALGLAAPQIGVNFRVIVVNHPDGPIGMINPEIIKTDGEIELEEGCLSFLRESAFIKRSKKIEVKYLDERGDEKVQTAEDLFAVCIQHEIDHLDGILFVDRMSNIKKDMVLKKFKKRGKFSS